MVRVELEISEADRERFARAAARQDMMLDDWLVAVARQHSAAPKSRARAPSKSPAELEAFWRWCDAQNDLEKEPDWEEHLHNMDESIRAGLPEV